MNDREAFEAWGDRHGIPESQRDWSRMAWLACAALASERAKQNAATNVGIDWANPATLNGSAPPAVQDSWEETARQYAENASFWREKYEATQKQAEPVAWMIWQPMGGPPRFTTEQKRAVDLQSRADLVVTPLVVPSEAAPFNEQVSVDYWRGRWEVSQEHLRRAMKQLRKWQEKYGAWQPDWLPPSGDMELADDIDAATSAVQAEPTQEMIADAWVQAQGKCDHDTLRRIYRVFAVAPAQQPHIDPITPDDRKRYYDFEKYADHLPTCKQPRGDQFCECGYSAVRTNLSDLLDELAAPAQQEPPQQSAEPDQSAIIKEYK